MGGVEGGTWMGDVRAPAEPFLRLNAASHDHIMSYPQPFATLALANLYVRTKEG